MFHDYAKNNLGCHLRGRYAQWDGSLQHIRTVRESRPLQGLPTCVAPRLRLGFSRLKVSSERKT